MRYVPQVTKERRSRVCPGIGFLKGDIMKENFRIVPSFPEFVTKWKTAQALGGKAIIPAVFLTSEDDCLLQEAISELTDTLIDTKAVRLGGTVPFLNLSIRRQRHFAEEFHRMYTTLKNHAGFCNDFKGIVAVDLSDWSCSGMDEDLDAVLSYLKDTQADRFYIFYASTAEPEKLANVLQLHFMLQSHQLKLDQTAQLLSFAVSKLRRDYSIELDGKAEASLGKIIRSCMDADDYRGVGSVTSMCRDMSYQLQSEGSLIMDCAFLTTYKHSTPSSAKKPAKPVVGLIK